MTQARPGQRAVVLGAGMVGIACALSLRQRGLAVTVIDPLGPGAATSHGNAGVLARSSLMPFNHPRLWSQLPHLLRGRNPRFRYHPLWTLGQWRWGLSFLAHAREPVFRETTAALDVLIRHSGTVHRRWMDEACVAQRPRDDGWLFLYRSEASFDGGAFGRDTLARFGVAMQALDANALHDLEPHLKPVFKRALWVQDASSVDSPGEVVRAYAAWLQAAGGSVVVDEVTTLLTPWRWLDGAHHKRHHAPGRPHRGGARPLVARLPAPAVRPAPAHGLRARTARALPARRGRDLNRPVYDTAGGYVLADGAGPAPHDRRGTQRPARGAPQGAAMSYALSYIVDDGAVFYVDGSEISRYKMPAGAVAYATLAPAAGAEGALFALPLGITSGAHTIAVSVHQSANTSSDTVFGAEIIVVPTVSPSLSVTHTGGNAVITWNADASWELVSSANANGPWAAVAGNPFRSFTTPSTQAAQFHQLRYRPQP